MTEADARKADAEIAKLIAEAGKLTIEATKLTKEARWFEISLAVAVTLAVVAVTKLIL